MENYVAEFVGTLVLVLFGVGAVAAANLKKSVFYGAGALWITTGWGLAVTLGVLVSGWRSGAHINPAITVGAFVMGGISLTDMVGYIIAQFLGAMAGATLVWMALKKQFDAEENYNNNQVFATGPAITSYGWNIVSEVIATTALFFIANVLGRALELPDMVSWYVGCLVWAIGISLGGATGFAVNPARDLGARFMFAILPIPHKADANWKYAWVPVVGPTLGGILGAILVKLYLGT